MHAFTATFAHDISRRLPMADFHTDISRRVCIDVVELYHSWPSSGISHRAIKDESGFNRYCVEIECHFRRALKDTARG